MISMYSKEAEDWLLENVPEVYRDPDGRECGDGWRASKSAWTANSVAVRLGSSAFHIKTEDEVQHVTGIGRGI